MAGQHITILGSGFGALSAVRELRADFAKAMAAAQALQAITGTLSDEQAGIVAKTMTAELTKQGF